MTQNGRNCRCACACVAFTCCLRHVQVDIGRRELNVLIIAAISARFLRRQRWHIAIVDIDFVLLLLFHVAVVAAPHRSRVLAAQIARFIVELRRSNLEPEPAIGETESGAGHHCRNAIGNRLHGDSIRTGCVAHATKRTLVDWRPYYVQIDGAILVR